MEMNTWTKLGTAVAVLSASVGIGFAILDHVKPKPSNPASVSGYGNVVGNTINGSGNIVGNQGPVTVNSGHVIPASEREAARQRLHDSGIEYSEERYSEALKDHQADIVDLFTKAGMRMSQGDLRVFATASDPDTEKALEQADQSSACPTDAYSSAWYGGLEGGALSFVRKVCGNNVVRGRLRATLENQQADLVKAQQADRDSEARKKQQIDLCEQAYMEAFRSRATRQAAQESCSYSHPGEYEPATPKAAARIPLTEKALQILQ